MALEKINNISSPEEINSIAYADIAKLGGIDVVHEFVPSGTPIGWWDASAITGLSDTDKVASWTDLSGNGNHLIEPTNQPTYRTGIQNGLPVVKFSGDSRLYAVIAGLEQPQTVFIVFRQTQWQENSYIIDGTDGPNILFVNGFTPQINLHCGTLGPVTTDMTIGDFKVCSIVSNGASSSIRVNGLNESIADAGAGNSGGLCIGRWAGGNFPYVEVCEVLLYSGTESRAANESGLATKWGL